MTQETSKPTAPAGRETKTAAKWPKILLGVVLIATCGVVRYYWGTSPAHANPSARSDMDSSRSVRPPRSSDDAADARESDLPARSPSARNRSDDSIPVVVATVNTKRIGREDLARDCLRHFGKEVLESMVNKRLIMLECQRRGIKVTRREVNDEIEEMAARFKIPVDQWLKMLKQERNVSPEQYADDIIWPTIALRKLAGEQLTVSDEEVRAEFDTQYGERIKVRLIAAGSLQKARELRAKAVADPADFGNLAKKYSEDSASASVKGVINPIRRHGSYRQIEEAVFNIRDGEITPVIHAGGQYVILQREEAIPAQDVAYRDVAGKLRAFLRDRKMRSIAQDVFRTLQERRRNSRLSKSCGTIRSDGNRCRAWPPPSTTTRSRSANWPSSASRATAAKSSTAPSTARSSNWNAENRASLYRRRRSTAKSSGWRRRESRPKATARPT